MRLRQFTPVPPMLAALFLAACAETGGGATATADDGTVGELPEAVLAIVAPGQDLTTVQLDETGCYVYRYVGPVETTYLPLRTVSGRPICTRPQV